MVRQYAWLLSLSRWSVWHQRWLNGSFVLTYLLEVFPVGCRNTKIEITTLTHHKKRKNITQSDFEAYTYNRRQARENACEHVTIGFSFM